MKFIREDAIFRRRYRLTWRGLVLDQVEVKNADNAARIFRRTMKPYAPVTVTFAARPAGFGDGALECISYPIVDDGVVSVMLRKVGDDGGELLQVECREVRPIQFSPRRTGIPVNDPLPVQLGRPA